MFVITSSKIFDVSFSVEASSGSGLDLLCTSSRYSAVSKLNDLLLPTPDSEFTELVKELMEFFKDIPFSSSGCWLVLDIVEYGRSFFVVYTFQ